MLVNYVELQVAVPKSWRRSAIREDLVVTEAELGALPQGTREGDRDSQLLRAAGIS